VFRNVIPIREEGGGDVQGWGKFDHNPKSLVLIHNFMFGITIESREVLSYKSLNYWKDYQNIPAFPDKSMDFTKYTIYTISSGSTKNPWIFHGFEQIYG
jgi:hypothetical protein